MHKQQSGFSLMELLTSVAIVGMLAAVVGPEFGDFSDNNKIRSSAREFQALILLARSEAVNRNSVVNLTSTDEDDWSGDISLCAIPDTLPAATPCFTNGTTTIRIANIGSDSVTIKSDGDADPIISFNSRGRLTGGTSATAITLAFCDQRGTDAGASAKILSINVTGRPNIENLDIAQGHSCDPE